MLTERMPWWLLGAMLPLGEAIVGFLKRGNFIRNYAALSMVKYFSIE
jgi:hypothetical protein